MHQAFFTNLYENHYFCTNEAKMKAHIAIVKETEVLTDCQEVFKEIIEKNSNGKYEIPRDLILKFLPQKVVDNFLDSLSDFTSEEINWVLEEIKNGNLTIICDDKGLN